MSLTQEQIDALDRLDSALCQYINNVGDEWDDPRWEVSVQKNLGELSEAYNECHKVKLMDLREIRNRSNITTERNEG